MSVQVSYKKQTLLGIIGLVFLIMAIEIIANVWWVTQINCEFEENEIFLQMDDDKRRQLCVDLFEIKTSGMELIPNQENQSITINSLGFRGDEFSVEKSSDVFRIFMLGGSTMFGYGATSNDTTIPGYVQKSFENNNAEYRIEIINSGIKGADSFDELNLLEKKLLDYAPNMIIIYDGWNDLRSQNSADEVLTNWNKICQLGQKNDFDVLVVLQPIAGFAGKPLTIQEKDYAENGKDYDNNLLINSIEEYDKYAENFENLENCTQSLDYRMIFDQESSPIYWDQGHMSDKGNKIVGKKLYDVLLKLLPENFVQSNELMDINEDTSESFIFETQIRSLISNYKTPIMINNVFSFKTFEDKTIQETKILVFETQSRIHNEDKISIILTMKTNENDSNKKFLEIRTINKKDNSNIPNVTYFLKISDGQKMIFNDFFYVENDTLNLEIISNEQEKFEITGERQYDHNAIIASVDPPLRISGPVLLDNVKYEFNFEIRTLYDPKNWIFSLDDFKIELSTLIL